MGVLLGVPDCRIEHVPDECLVVRQSVFPQTGFAGIGGGVEVVPLLAATGYVCDSISDVRHQGR